MSSPTDRPFDTDGVSPYAPKWARERSGVTGHRAGPQVRSAGGDEMATPTDSSDFEVEHFRLPGSQVPGVVPEPPMQELWPRDDERSVVRGGGGTTAFFPFVFAVFLAALIAFVIVVEMPKIQSFVAKQRAAIGLAAAESDNASKPPIVGPAVKASKFTPAPAPSSGSRPAIVEQRVAATDAAISALALPQSPMPTQPAVATPAPVKPAPATSLPANPAAAVLAPPAANATPSTVSAPITSVKTAPIQPETPMRSLGRDEIETLLKQGEDFVAAGDFASARFLFRRVWEANDARGALAFASTYDPIVLAGIGAKGASPDVAKAREWYAKAKDLGFSEAAARLQALANTSQ